VIAFAIASLSRYVTSSLPLIEIFIVCNTPLHGY
jgi:hypothetical protein